VLFDRISNNLRMLCFHDGIIVNTDNDIIYNGGSYEFLIVTSDMSLNELSRMLCDQLAWNDIGPPHIYMDITDPSSSWTSCGDIPDNN
jgi:hypothetical protein